MVAVTYGSARIAAATSPAAKTRPKAPGKGFFARLLDAMMETRMQEARREIARHRHLMQDWQYAIAPVRIDELPFGR